MVKPNPTERAADAGRSPEDPRKSTRRVAAKIRRTHRQQPDQGAFQDVESRLTGDEIRAAMASMKPTILNLRMPKFEYEAEISLAETLAAMGMPDAFDPASADFSGMDGTRDLSVSGIFHKAFVAVDEEGTEAAAATALVIGLTSIVMPDLELTVDRPFIFLIRDIETNSILFVGRVLSPMGS